MVFRLGHNRDAEAVNPFGVPFHVIFLAKTNA